MGKLKTFTRRAFLVGSATIAGGVAFGAYIVKRDPENPLQADLDEGAAAFNPWVMIDAEKVTLIAPHGDKGQGVLSTQAALIAEEMDLEWGQFEVSFGTPAAAYWNRALGADGAPFMATDESFTAETARAAIGAVTKVLGMQGTGGSSSMPDSYVKLREAGAMARETLKLAAARRAGVDVADVTTAGGKVILPGGEEIAYTALAAEAAEIEPVEGTPLRDASEWRLLGQPMERLDIVAKSTGTQDYGIDVTVEGMVHASVCLNPAKGAALESFDASAAEAMAGVQGVYEVTGGVAVVANNTWVAIQGARAVECVWAEADYPAEQAEHWAVLEQSFGEDSLDQEWRNDGDIEGAMAGDGTVIEAEYRMPYVAHQPLEPLNAIVQVTEDQVDVWTGHQMPRFLQQQVAAITGHDAEQVVFHNQFMGGSFGHRLEFEHLKQCAEVANQMRGTPVKLTYSREEDFSQDFTRHIAMGRGRAVVQGGRVEGLDLGIASPSVVASQMSRLGINVPGPDSQIVAGGWNNPYALPNLRVRGYRANGLAPTSSWRAVGANNGGFAFDCLLDEAIHAAGADPLEERIRLMEHDVSRKVLEAVGEMSSWGGELAQSRARGVAFVESFGVPTAEVIEVEQTDAGVKLTHVWVACDVGRVLDPVNFENLVQGGVIFGLGHAINSEITYEGGRAVQSNYHAHEGMRMYQCPPIEVRGLENGGHVRGIGEPPTPPAAPALANAIFALTGQRIREMPFNKHIDFV